MAIVTGLFIYPVKSCGGIKLSEAHLLETGLALSLIHISEPTRPY